MTKINGLFDLWPLDRTYFITPFFSKKRVLDDLKLGGLCVNGTREFLNTKIVISDIYGSSDHEWDEMGANHSEVNALCNAIDNEDDDFVSETYNAKYYTFLKEAIESAREFFSSDCIETRRAVIQFPTTHCFETIQVLIRDKKCVIAVNMRSCNAYKNLMNDAYLSYKVAMAVALGFDIDDCVMSMNIGSLHLFEEDLKYVL